MSDCGGIMVENITSDAVMATKGSKFGKLPTLVDEKYNSSLKSNGLSNGDKCTHCGKLDTHLIIVSSCAGI